METITQKVLTCKKCKHKWIPRIEREPVSCPRCKRNDWNNPTLSGSKVVQLKKEGVEKKN